MFLLLKIKLVSFDKWLLNCAQPDCGSLASQSCPVPQDAKAVGIGEDAFGDPLLPDMSL